MKSATQCLQTSDIEALLAGTVPASQSELWEEHFSSCESCRMAMAGQVGDQEWWREAEQSLVSASIPEVRDFVKSDADERESIEDLLKLLGPTDDPQMLGRIGSYEVLGVLGRGGMGVVFKAFDAPLNRFVAIKMLLPHLAASGAARKRFAREGQAVAAVVDDHVMAIHCVDEWQGVPYLVMTYSRGVSLQKRLSDNGPLEVREILRIGMQAAKGLAAAHAQGIVHRDIKPANIFLDQNVERVQLMDFGLARAVDDASLTRSGTLAGTPQYMSPEQARAETVDHRSDLFSLGSVLYAMCTGHAPFRAESSYSVLRLITDTVPRSIREINPDIPEWLCLLISRLMAKSPDARFGNALEVAALLEQCLAHVQQPTSVPLPASLVLHAAGRRSIFLSTRKGMIAMIGTIGMILLGMVLLQATEAPDISGQWASEEWSTVVLEAKGSGEYEGTFTGSGKDKPVPSNDPPVGGTGDVSRGSGSRINISAIGPAPLALDFPGGGSDGLGVSPKSEPDALSDSDKTKSGRLDWESPQKFHSIIGVMVDGELKHYDSGANFPFPTVPSPTVRVLDKTQSGTVHLKWSRVERRFNGTWGKGADRSGTMSLRMVDKEIRGGFTTDEDVQLETGTPLVGDLMWTRSVVRVPDGGNVLLGGTKTNDEAANTQRKLSPGEILVEVYGGRGIWKSQETQNEVGKLLLSLKAVKGVTVDIREDGEGDAVTKAVVHMPAHAGEKNAESTKQEALIRTIKIAIDEALRTHRVPDVRWLDGIGKQQYFPAEWSGDPKLGDPKPVTPNPPAAPGKQQKQPSQTSVTFQAIMFDMDAELITEFPAGTLQHLGPTDFGDEFKQLIDKGRVTIVSRPQIRTQMGQTSTVQFGMSIAVRSPDKGEMMRRIVGEALLMTPREVDGEIVLDIQFTSEQPLKDVAQPAEDVTLQSNTFSFRVPLKKYERNGVVLGPFVMPNKKLRCIHLVKEDNSVDQQDKSLKAASVSGIAKPLLKQPAAKAPAVERPLDRQNARAVVEAFVAAALAGDGETVVTLAKLNRRDPKRPTERIENMIKFFPDHEHLPMTSVHVNDAENPTDAIAISKQFKWEHPSSERKTDVVAWFTLSMSEAGWIVTNISFEWIESTDGLLKKHLEANPKSISVPPLMPMSLSNKPSEVLTAEQAIKNGKELIVSQKKVVVRLRVLDARITTRSGAEFVWELRSTERSVGVSRRTPFIIEVPTMVEAEHKRLGVHDLEEHYVGKLIEVEGAISQLSIPGFIGGYAIRVRSLDQIRIVDPRVPDANDQQSIRWGEPVNGLRLGAKFEGANNQDAMQFRHGDRANIQLFLQNVSDQETACGFDPFDVCKWHNSPWRDPLKQPADEVLRIKQHNGEFVEPEPLRNSDGSHVTYMFAGQSTNYAKLLPQEIRRIDGQLGALGRTGREVPVKDFVGFHIVAQKSAEPARQHPQEYVLPSGKHMAAIAINFFNVGKQIRLECPALQFEVADGTPIKATGNAAMDHIISETLSITDVENVIERLLKADMLKQPAEDDPAIERPLDRQNARAVVEAFVAAAIAGDETTINTLAPISRSQAGVELYVGELKFLKLAKLRIESVYVNDMAKPTKALATSVEVRLEGKTPRLHEPHGGFLVLTLSMSENGWSVTDINFDSKETADRELKVFLEAYPKAISVPPQAASETAKPATGLAESKTVISDLGLWVVPASAEEVLALGVTRTPAVPGGVRVTKIVPGGYIDTQIKARKLKFEVGELVHSVAARDVTSAKDVSRNILSARREGHSGFFIGTASTTGLGRFSVEFSELLTDPKTGEIQLPPLQFHIVAANAVKDPVDESGHAWFPIGGDFRLKRYDNAHTNWDHLKFPIEKIVGDKRLGLVGDSDATSIPWDGSWHIEKCELSADPNNQNAFRVDVTVDSHASELLRKLTSAHQGERLAVIVEERIVLAPTIGSVIEKSFSITGTFTKVEAEQLVQAIRRGIKLEPEWKLPNTAVPFIEVPKVQNAVPERKLPPVDGTPVHPRLSDDTAWGKEVDGLQAGLGLDYGNRRTYGHGQGITLVVRLRNVGKEAVKFEYLRQFLDENPPTVTNADDKTIPQSKTEVMGQHVPVIVTLEPGKEMVLETRLHGSSGVPYVLIPPNSKEKRDDKVTPLVVATGKVQLQIEKVFGNSSSGFLKVDPALEKLSTGKLELEVIR